MKKKAKTSKTRPEALTKDGTLYRIINVICSVEGRALFLHTKRVLSYASLDSGEKNMSLYKGMLDLYRDMLEYNMIDVLDQSQMVGYGVEDDAAMNFEEFKECLDFIMAHYWEAHNNNNKSGSHQPFVDYTSRKSYLLYLHLQSGEIGLDAQEYASFLFNKDDNRDMSLLNACSDIQYSLLKCRS